MTGLTHAMHLLRSGLISVGEVGIQLQATLIELIDHSLLGKQLHWNVVGRLSRPPHEQLDELVARWRELADTVAERAVAIGCFPDGQSSALTESKLAGVEHGELEDRVVSRELTGRLAGVVERVRERMDRLGELDPVSQDA